MTALLETGTSQAAAEDVDALLAKALQHVVDGTQLAGYARRVAGSGDPALRAMRDHFEEACGRLDSLLRHQLAANLLRPRAAAD